MCLLEHVGIGERAPTHLHPIKTDAHSDSQRWGSTLQMMKRVDAAQTHLPPFGAGGKHYFSKF